MKKGKRIALTILWLVVVIGFTAWSWIAREQALEPVTVYRITQEIPLNSRVGMSDFQAVEVPGQAVSSDMIRNPEEVVDLHASTRLLPGQYAIDGMFVEADEVDPFETADLTQMRQITIPASYVDALGGNIARGDVIDLVYVGTGRTDDGGEYTYSRTFAQNVLVYAVTTDSGYRFQNHSDRLEGQPVSQDERDIALEDGVSFGDIGQVTLAVSPSLAEEIAARTETGAIQLVGRFSESEDADTAGYIVGEFERQFTGQGNPETSN